MSVKRVMKLTLPQPVNGGSSLTCYVDVVEPNGVFRTYEQVVTVNPTTMSTTTFDS